MPMRRNCVPRLFIARDSMSLGATLLEPPGSIMYPSDVRQEYHGPRGDHSRWLRHPCLSMSPRNCWQASTSGIHGPLTSIHDDGTPERLMMMSVQYCRDGYPYSGTPELPLQMRNAQPRGNQPQLRCSCRGPPNSWNHLRQAGVLLSRMH